MSQDFLHNLNHLAMWCTAIITEKKKINKQIIKMHTQLKINQQNKVCFIQMKQNDNVTCSKFLSNETSLVLSFEKMSVKSALKNHDTCL